LEPADRPRSPLPIRMKSVGAADLPRMPPRRPHESSWQASTLTGLSRRTSTASPSNRRSEDAATTTRPTSRSGNASSLPSKLASRADRFRNSEIGERPPTPGDVHYRGVLGPVKASLASLGGQAGLDGPSALHVIRLQAGDGETPGRRTRPRSHGITKPDISTLQKTGHLYFALTSGRTAPRSLKRLSAPSRIRRARPTALGSQGGDSLA